MLTVSERRKTRAVVYLLDQAGHFNRLAKECPDGFQGRFYRLKDGMLIAAVAKAPEQFDIDSVAEDGTLLGITHRPTGRRAHLYVDRLPPEAAAILRRLPMAGATCHGTCPESADHSRAGQIRTHLCGRPHLPGQ